MTDDRLNQLAMKFSHELFFYPWQFFELRIQEEMVRADRNGRIFGYWEIRYHDVCEYLTQNISEDNGWMEILFCLTQSVRGSDIKGFLEGQAGLGVVLLDTNRAGVLDCRRRFFDYLKDQDVLNVKDEKTANQLLRITVYPEDAQKIFPR